MTDRRVALIRGINVGTAKRVGMAELRALVEGLGYGDVSTLLNSGNVIFSCPRSVRGDPGDRIERAMTATLGLSAKVIVMTGADVAVAVEGNPFGEIANNPSRLMVAVLREPAARSRLAAVTKQNWLPERIALGARVAYLWSPEGVQDSKLTKAVAKALGDAVTTRNFATMTKLVALMGGGS
jgi:uncharacterized protein (DUF1697 family)